MVMTEACQVCKKHVDIAELADDYICDACQKTCSLTQRIEAIPDVRWHNNLSRNRYLKCAKKLVELGMTEQEAAIFVSDLYYAAADCFGG